MYVLVPVPVHDIHKFGVYNLLVHVTHNICVLQLGYASTVASSSVSPIGPIVGCVNFVAFQKVDKAAIEPVAVDWCISISASNIPILQPPSKLLVVGMYKPFSVPVNIFHNIIAYNNCRVCV